MRTPTTKYAHSILEKILASHLSCILATKQSNVKRKLLLYVLDAILFWGKKQHNQLVEVHKKEEEKLV